MLLLIVGGVLVSAGFVIAGVRELADANSASLGCMSAQWLAEHRASDSP